MPVCASRLNNPPRLLRWYDYILCGNRSVFRTARRRYGLSTTKHHLLTFSSGFHSSYGSQSYSGKTMKFALIICGAAVGAPARFAIDQYIRRYTTKPYGVFVVNILGSFLLGLTYGRSEQVHDLLAVGFAGAFTTWSTFMLDIYLAYELKRYKEAVANLTISLGFGLLAAWLGLQIA